MITGTTERVIVLDSIVAGDVRALGVQPVGRATNSHDNNLLWNNTIDNIGSSEYRLSQGSSIIIGGQNFDDVLITVGDSASENFVEIFGWGIKEVREVPNEQEEEADDTDKETEEEENEEMLYDTDSQSYTRRISGGGRILVNS